MRNGRSGETTASTMDKKIDMYTRFLYGDAYSKTLFKELKSKIFFLFPFSDIEFAKISQFRVCSLWFAVMSFDHSSQFLKARFYVLQILLLERMNFNFCKESYIPPEAGLNRIIAVEECDARMPNSSNVAQDKKIIYKISYLE